MSKINQILTEWVPGDIQLLSWFKERGIPQNLALPINTLRTELEKRVPGIYSRKNEKLNWRGGVRLLQNELEKKIQVQN